MSLLILLLVFAVFALIVFVFSLPCSNASRLKEKTLNQDSEKDKVIYRLKKQIAFFEGELRKEKEKFRESQADLKKAKEKEIELNREKEADTIDKKLLENVKKELSEVKCKLIDKDRVVDKEYSLNLKLSKELQETKQQIDALKKDFRRATDLTRNLELESHDLRRNIVEQEKIIVHMKKKDEESSWISKKEYYKIEKELKDKRKEIEELESKLKGK